MEIFHNRDRPNYEEVKSYGPKWLAEFREMDANYRFAGWTLDLAAHFSERIILNLFPEYADEQTLTMFERLLNIEYDSPNVSLEERRRTVSAYFYGIGKLNKTSIINMAEKYTGCKCTVYWKGSLLYISAISDLDDILVWNYDYGKLAVILRRRMPAHLGFGFRSYFKPIIVNNEQDIQLINIENVYQISFWGCRLLDGSWLLDGSCFLDSQRRYNLLAAVNHFFKINSAELERIENVSVVSKSKDCWFLDGEISLDGTRALDSMYREEAI